MAVKSTGSASGPGSRYRRPTLQRGIDAVSEYADVAAAKLGAVSDPRARLLRKRRWALRFGEIQLGRPLPGMTTERA